MRDGEEKVLTAGNMFYKPGATERERRIGDKIERTRHAKRLPEREDEQ
jgi:hypothetical protein